MVYFEHFSILLIIALPLIVSCSSIFEFSCCFFEYSFITFSYLILSSYDRKAKRISDVLNDSF